MEKLNYNDVINGKGFASDYLREDVKNDIKENDVLVNFAYTDYGGDFFDKVCIEYFKKYHHANICHEETGWNGQNAFIFGQVAIDFWQEIENYLLGYENIEEFYTTMEYEQSTKDFDYFLNDVKDCYIFNFDKVLEWLIENKSGYYSMLPNGLDFSWDSLINELIENNLIFNNSDSLLASFIDKGYNRNISEYYIKCYENGTIKDINISEETRAIFKEYENNLK